ncbi:putative mucin-6-like [Sesbania bispinosa]|nr:putative mucin-6-like [Sesbania bispinosa]
MSSPGHKSLTAAEARLRLRTTVVQALLAAMEARLSLWTTATRPLLAAMEAQLRLWTTTVQPLLAAIAPSPLASPYSSHLLSFLSGGVRVVGFVGFLLFDFYCLEVWWVAGFAWFGCSKSGDGGVLGFGSAELVVRVTGFDGVF